MSAWRARAAQAEEDDSLQVEREAPAWLISLVLHLAALLLLALLTSPVGEKMTTIVLEVGQSADEGEALESFELAMVEPEIGEAAPSDAAEVTEELVEIPQEQIVADALIEQMVPVQAEVAAVSLPTEGMLSGRSGSTKQTLLSAYGGTAETEAAVQLGLEWLKRQQLSSGAWSLSGPYEDGAFAENRIAATAMALLAFQGNGNTHQTGEYRETVKAAAEWLVAQQGRDGAFGHTGGGGAGGMGGMGGMGGGGGGGGIGRVGGGGGGSRGSRRGQGFPPHQQLYSQAQATIAICELYAMTGDSWLHGPAQRAIEYAEWSQSSLGGWRYEPRRDADTSVTGWFMMALQSGRAGGLEVSDEVLRKVGYYLDSVQHYDGAAYAYQPGNGPSQAMTAEGMLCRQYLGWERERPEMQLCAESLVTDYNFDIYEPDFYYWYYATQMLHHYGGEPWRLWNEAMRSQLPTAQVRSGREVGSWAPQKDRWGGTGGRLYTTCFAIYCLEVYYRHMPLYQH
ncbi:prenyltransferase/squalene oxidase repeat-containing protein [Candidatus Laterigemmans baculatus]|uniref:prenyltransferase/squalene oxidase repeat-containing protein n=1 Tax=Candidatus Laterigemmans baculatus TaxID=2770505 RepID=UPI0013DB6D37|nr:prenyltransferase/squalene oxidase repeat-containing protein [Candidatus Laterigemmans baculatus]